MAHDNLHATYMAEQIAKAMLPNVVVATPINISKGWLELRCQCRPQHIMAITYQNGRLAVRVW